MLHELSIVSCPALRGILARPWAFAQPSRAANYWNVDRSGTTGKKCLCQDRSYRYHTRDAVS